ncbi:hypothetical protein CU097_010470 [Rhizopus azygosporus]|uniref:Nudix hydrolase domain-containing protein n=1 Tax=Rhizopus azygosporus TaxID=86630 RepID=A0A367K0E6_RHIAZ|nr:hypothetical protein CU097_010470 [Rhizopus azygosporus]CEI88144.1 hypothetical protein RMCBS344292_02544 [Rhizopus microsporus]
MSNMTINTEETEAIILEDKVVYKRYITVWDRTTQFKDGRVIKWDIVGHDTSYPTFVVVFTFDTTKKTTCILKEYCQGTNEMKYTCVAGAYDKRKHKSALEAAQHELSEEAHLKQGEWINLLPPSQPADGISELKWGKNRFVPYICINPIQDDTPMNRDYEEHIEIIRDVPIDQLRKFITRGEMMLPSVQTCWMAIEYLKENNLL